MAPFFLLFFLKAVLSENNDGDASCSSLLSMSVNRERSYTCVVCTKSIVSVLWCDVVKTPSFHHDSPVCKVQF